MWVINAVNEYFEGLDKSNYKNGITALEHHYEKCISLDKDYVEKYNLKKNSKIYQAGKLIKSSSYLYFPGGSKYVSPKK